MATFKMTETTFIELPKICMEPLTITIPANSKEHIIKVPCYVALGNTALTDENEELLQIIKAQTGKKSNEIIGEALGFLHLSNCIMEAE